jgi:hypothetical protein
MPMRLRNQQVRGSTPRASFSFSPSGGSIDSHSDSHAVADLSTDWAVSDASSSCFVSRASMSLAASWLKLRHDMAVRVERQRDLRMPGQGHSASATIRLMDHVGNQSVAFETAKRLKSRITMAPLLRVQLATSG